MPEFGAKLLKRAYSFYRMRLPQKIVFGPEVVKKIEGKTKHHSYGDIPISVVLNSLEGTILVVPKGSTSDVQIITYGKAVDGMLDGSPEDPKSRPLEVETEIFILTPILMGKNNFEAKTSYRILRGKYSDLKSNELSLEAWSSLYNEKTGMNWELSEREKKRLKKTSGIWYNDLRGDGPMRIHADVLVLKEGEEIEYYRLQGYTDSEIEQHLREVHDTSEEDAEMEAYWAEIRASGADRS